MFQSVLQYAFSFTPNRSSQRKLLKQADLSANFIIKPDRGQLRPCGESRSAASKNLTSAFMFKAVMALSKHSF
jgi:hypothetical protein